MPFNKKKEKPKPKEKKPEEKKQDGCLHLKHVHWLLTFPFSYRTPMSKMQPISQTYTADKVAISPAQSPFFCDFKVSRNESINWEKEIRTVWAETFLPARKPSTEKRSGGI